MKKKLARIVVLLVIALMVLPQMPVAGQDKVSITFWHMEEPAYRVERFQTLIDEFNAANPDIEVKQEVLGSNLADLRRKVGRLLNTDGPARLRQQLERLNAI